MNTISSRLGAVAICGTAVLSTAMLSHNLRSGPAPQAQAPTELSPDLSGVYRVQGTTEKYGGQLQIRKSGDSYDLKWTLDGEGTQVGTGIQTGPTLSSTWNDGKKSGVVVYRLGPNGRDLNGLYLVDKKSKVDGENLTLLRR